MRLDEGRPVIVAAAFWHLPHTREEGEEGEDGLAAKALCGLRGPIFRLAGPIRDRRGCVICLQRAGRRGGYNVEKPRGGSQRYVSDVQLAVLHRAYVEQGLSIRQLAEKVWQQLGYRSPRACSNGLYNGFRDQGYKLRDRIEATVAASTKHGLAPKHRPRPGYGTYRRRTLAGKADRPQCAGTRTQYPRKGQRCRRRALVDSEFCFNHDPRNRDRQIEHLAAIREASGRI